jgi:hypothetical protein
MTEANAAAIMRDYVPDPFNLQIGAMIVMHRARRLPHSAATVATLEDIAAGLMSEADSLIEESGEPSPFNPNSVEQLTPPEPFMETSEYIGHTQRLLKPTIGMEIRHFRLVPKEDTERSLTASDPNESGMDASVDLIQHHDTMWWQVLHAEVWWPIRRQGAATQMYDRIAEVLDCEMRTSGWLSDDAYRFWQKRGHFTMDWYRQPDHLGGLWINPKALLNLEWLARRRMERLLESVDASTPN